MLLVTGAAGAVGLVAGSGDRRPVGGGQGGGELAQRDPGVRAFYDCGALTRYRLVGYLSAGNHLQALNLDRAQEGGTWNDKIDQIRVC